MKRKNTARNALFTSIISLLLCVTMLVGATFAWFTDKVESGINTIAAGNLDVELYHSDKNDSGDVGTSTKLFNDVTLWEPGAVVYENFVVENKGNLALKYQLSINFENETVVDGHGLSEVLKVAVVEGGFTGGREDAKKLDLVPMKSFVLSGALEGNTTSKTYGIVIYWQPTENDNWFNMNNDNQGETLTIDLGVNLFATQKMYEEDSFGKDYDANAILPWDNSADTSWYDASKTEIVLYTAEELAGLSKLVAEGNSFSGKTVKLGANIDLGGKSWTPIGSCNSKAYFQGAFDGQGNTIYNLYIDNSDDGYKYSTSGLFGWVDAAAATVKNVNVDGATVKGSHWVGVIAGFFTGEISNCTVTNATVIGYNVNDDANGDKVGGIVGYMNTGAGKLDGNSITNSTVTGYRDVAGLAGAVATTNTVTNNKVEKVVVTYSSDYVGEIVSPKTSVTVDNTNTATNVTITKAVSVTVSTADELREALNSDADNISIILANDIAIDIGTGWKMGGANTKSITIQGASSETVLTLSNTYRSYFNLANPDGTLYLQDLKLTNTHKGTHFFDFTTHFNCDVVATNVAFLKAPLTSAVTAVFNNCTFAEPVASYSLWIMAGSDVTVNGASFNATRGIKIADEDTADAVTTLTVKDATFNTTQKAAIVVASDLGANITLSNVNIANTIDTVHAVWVDEDYPASDAAVTVAGGEKIYEGNVASNASELADAVAAGATNIYLLPGEWDVIVADSGVTYNGAPGTVVGAVNLNGSNNVTLKNITFDAAKAQPVYDNSTQRNYACVFGASKGGSVGARNIVIDGCNFTGTFANGGAAIAFADKSRVSGGSGNITIKNCTFATTGAYYDIYMYYSGYGSFNIEGNTFDSECLGQPIYLGKYQSSTPVVVKGNAFENVDSFENAASIQEHSSSYTVSFDDADNTFGA